VKGRSENQKLEVLKPGRHFELGFETSNFEL